MTSLGRDIAAGKPLCSPYFINGDSAYIQAIK
jgi:hypothetical protein